MSSSAKELYYQLAIHNLAVAIALPILDTFAVALRVYARRKQKLPLKLDDWFIIPALIFTLGASAAMIVGISMHAEGHPVPRPSADGRMNSSLTPQEAVALTSKVEYAILLLVTAGLYCVKMSLLCFYERIFCVHKMDSLRLIIYGAMILVALWGLGFWFAHLFACGTHFSAFWGSPIDLATKCTQTLKLEYAFSITDFALDCVIFIIPIPRLCTLRLQTARRIAVIIIFMIGAGAVAASATRLALVAQVVQKGFDPREDEDLVITGMMYWLLVELSLALLAACLPTIRVLFAGFSAESIINSIRSAISLHSMRSHSSHEQIPDHGEIASRS